MTVRLPEAAGPLHILERMTAAHGGPIFARLNSITIKIAHPRDATILTTPSLSVILSPMITRVKVSHGASPLRFNGMEKGGLRRNSNEISWLICQLVMSESRIQYLSVTPSDDWPTDPFAEKLFRLQFLQAITLLAFDMRHFYLLARCTKLRAISVLDPHWGAYHLAFGPPDSSFLALESLSFATTGSLTRETGSFRPFCLRKAKMPQLRRLSLRSGVYLVQSDIEDLEHLRQHSPLLEELDLDLDYHIVHPQIITALLSFNNLQHLRIDHTQHGWRLSSKEPLQNSRSTTTPLTPSHADFPNSKH